MPKTVAVEDERHACGISPPAAVDGGAYGRDHNGSVGIFQRTNNRIT